MGMRTAQALVLNGTAESMARRCKRAVLKHHVATGGFVMEFANHGKLTRGLWVHVT